MDLKSLASSVALLIACNASHLSNAQAKPLVESRNTLTESFVAQTNNERESHAVLRIGPIDVKKDTLLDVRFQIGLTTNAQSPVMVGREIRLCPDIPDPCGHLIVPALATNLGRQRHHEILFGSALYEASTSIKDAYITLFIWANHHSRSDQITVEPNGALLQVNLSN